MSLTSIASVCALITLLAPASVAARSVARPAFGRSRRGPALILIVAALSTCSQLLGLAGAPAAGGVVRLMGTVAFAQLCLELLRRAPRAS